MSGITERMTRLTELCHGLRDRGEDEAADFLEIQRKQLGQLRRVADFAGDYLSVISGTRREAREYPEENAYDLLNEQPIAFCEAALRESLEEAGYSKERKAKGEV